MKVWIVRNGGFAWVEGWYGPVDAAANAASLDGCTVEALRLANLSAAR